jgi:signal transduction histidine kinase
MKLFYQPNRCFSQLICMFVVLLFAARNAYAGDLQVSDWLYFEDSAQIQQPLAALQVFSRGEALAEGEQRGLIRSYKPPFNVGNVDKYFWFHSRLQNNSEQAQMLRLLAALPYRQLLNAYVVDQQQVKHVLQEGVNNVFQDRAYPHRWQISSQFSLPPVHAVDLVVQYHAVGSSYLPLDVIDEIRLMEIVKDDTVSAALFYSFSIAAILLFLLFGIAMQDRTSMLYAALFSIALLMLSAMEGYAFMYLWPGLPRWNHFSSVVIAYLFCSFGFYVAYKAVEPSQQKRVLPAAVLNLFLALSVTAFVMALLTYFLPFVFMVNMTSLFVALMFVAHAYAIYGWARARPERLLKRNVIAMISAVLIAVSVVVLVLLSLNLSIFPAYVYVHSSRIIFILAGLATMATIISHVSGLRRDYEESLQQAVTAANREAEINRELYEAEQRYNQVKALASLRQQQLAEASHDMRQPLVSLRSTIDTITQDHAPQLKEQLANAFSYLENLCNTYLRETRPQTSNDTAADLSDSQPAQEYYNEHHDTKPYPVKLVLETVHRMFESDANSNDIELKVQPSSLMISPDATIVMRIVSNLVANAIKHAGKGKVVLGVRRRQGASSKDAAIVVADNGAGITPEMLATITQAYEKGPESTGEGLGLAICKQLAEQHGMRLEISSEKGKGTCCQLYLHAWQ